MTQRTHPVRLGFALVLFVLGTLAMIVPSEAVGVAVLVSAAVQLGRAKRADGWAIVDSGVGVWLILLAGTILVTPAWGIPLLFITAGGQLVRSLGEIGMGLNLILLAAVAYARAAPSWTVALLVIVAVGKFLWYLRTSRRSQSPSQPAGL